MRLLLDEHYPTAIAIRLRGLGHDAVAVQERPDLIGLADRALLERMRDEGRAIVTEDRGDFGRLLKRGGEDLADHAGLVLVVPGRFPRGLDGGERLALALDGLLRRDPAEARVPGCVLWLASATPAP